MAYNENLANRIRERLIHLSNMEEKHMFGGIAFMVDNKMCVGIIKDEMMCRIDPELHEESVEKTGCRTMDFNKRLMKGYVMIDETGMKSQKEFDFWIELALDFNKKAVASKKTKKITKP